MYKVMLVSEEQAIIDEILNTIDCSKFDLDVIQIVGNEDEAFSKFKTHNFDIVILDVNICKIDQVILIKKLMKTNYKAKFIALGDYENFSYLKKNIEHDVISYILKPINKQEFIECLKQLILNINNTIYIEKTILRKNIALQYLEGKINYNELFESENSLINIPLENKNYSVSIITIVGKYNEDLYIELEKIISTILNDKFEILHKNNGQVVIINSWKNSITTNDLENYYNKIKNKIIDSFKIEVFISIGCLVNNLYEICESYNNAKYLSKYMLTEGINSCLSNRHIVSKSELRITFEKEIEEINRLIIEQNIDVLSTYIDEIFENKQLMPKNIYELSLKILFLINRILEEFKLNVNYIEYGLISIIVRVYDENTRESIKSIIINELRNLVELISGNKVKYSPVVQQIISIVNERYYEELSLKTLSQKYNVNSSYLGQIFNKEVGISFSEYLNKIKNIKAKELILNTNMKINDIARTVGYLDTSYFYRKFKKYFGVCPSTIRNMKKY